MINIENLSIEDWVLLDGSPFQIIGINPPYVDLLGNGNKLRLYDAYKEELRPIPITPEILEKNGVALAEDSDENCGLFTCPAFSVVKYGNSYTFEVPQARVRVEHVHELQHTMRLAGINREIEV